MRGRAVGPRPARRRHDARGRVHSPGGARGVAAAPPVVERGPVRLLRRLWAHRLRHAPVRLRVPGGRLGVRAIFHISLADFRSAFNCTYNSRVLPLMRLAAPPAEVEPLSMQVQPEAGSQ